MTGCRRGPSGSLFPAAAAWGTGTPQVCRDCGQPIRYTRRGTWEHSEPLTIRYCSNPDGHAPKDCPDLAEIDRSAAEGGTDGLTDDELRALRGADR